VSGLALRPSASEGAVLRPPDIPPFVARRKDAIHFHIQGAAPRITGGNFFRRQLKTLGNGGVSLHLWMGKRSRVNARKKDVTSS